MIIEVYNTEDLINKINNDKLNNSSLCKRFPIRFILMPSLTSLKEVIFKLLEKVNIDKVLLYEEISEKDKFLTPDEIIKLITVKIAHKKDTIVISLSEIIRFYPSDDFNRIINNLIQLENNNTNSRIYIPILGLENKLLKILKNTPRIRDKEWVPIWKIKKETETIKVYLTNLNLQNNLKNMSIIKGIKEWMTLWKSEKNINNDKLIINSNTLMNSFTEKLNDDVINIYKLQNYKEVLLYLFNCNIPIQYKNQEEKFWLELLHIPNIINKNFKEIIKDYFNINKINNDEIIDLWIKAKKPVEKWLLKHYTINNLNEKSYLYHIMKKYDDIIKEDNLLWKLWIDIFDSTQINYDFCYDFCIERKCLLTRYYKLNPSLNKMFPKEQENYIKSEINKIKDIKLILCLITGLLYWEKELLINMIKEGKIKDFSVLKDTYKHLYYYTKSMNLEYINNSGLWFNEYIKEYKYSKLYNEPNNKLKKILHTKNKNKDTFFEWYYEFETVDTVLDKYEIDNVFWLDAVGCEWTSLIENILQKDFNIYNIKISIGRAKLPTITDYNKYNEYNKYFQDYDKLIHQEYKYPKSFIQEIELISNIIKKLPIEKSKNTAIISDHGTSVFPRLMNKKYNFEKAEHGGRYIFENNIENNTEDYFIYKTDNENKKCIITLNHYSLYKIPKGEVHGGATPEEVLIPIILILNNLYDSYNIHPKKLSIRRRNPCIEINITPVPKINPILKIKNEQIDNKLIYDEKKNVWTTSLETLNAGKYTAEIIIGTFKDKIHIEIKSGLTKTDDFF